MDQFDYADELPEYLVRRSDFMIFKFNKKFNAYNTLDSPQEPYMHFTYRNLTQNYDYFPINKDEIYIYKAKKDEYYTNLAKR